MKKVLALLAIASCAALTVGFVTKSNKVVAKAPAAAKANPDKDGTLLINKNQF